MAMVILSTIYLGVLIVDGLLLVTRNSYVFTMDTELLTRYHGTPITTCRGY